MFFIRFVSRFKYLFYLCTANLGAIAPVFSVDAINFSPNEHRKTELHHSISREKLNGKVKIITGIRRCGKSYLLSTLYKQHLLSQGVPADSFIEVDLEKKRDVRYRNPNELYDYVMQRSSDMSRRFYVFIDEIQLSYKVKNGDVDERDVPEEDRDLLYVTFYDVLNDLKKYGELSPRINKKNIKENCDE